MIGRILVRALGAAADYVLAKLFTPPEPLPPKVRAKKLDDWKPKGDVQ